MAGIISRPQQAFKCALQRQQVLLSHANTFRRFQYTGRNALAAIDHEPMVCRVASPLARLPTVQLMRNLLLGYMFTSPLLSRLGISALKTLANPRSWWTDPDRNKLLGWVVRPVVYDHFCAGVNSTEVSQKIKHLRTLGYSGVILCAPRETLVEKNTMLGYQDQGFDAQIADWHDVIQETINMVEDGDFVGIKFSGAGSRVAQALANGDDPPKQLQEALNAIFQNCKDRRVRLWIDAEQQVLQTTVDRWAVRFMRDANREGRAVLSNTYQAYLKSIRPTLLEHLRSAQKEGWVLGIKLVRGAYITTDPRERIHDTKADTDNSYDGIAKNLLEKKFEGLASNGFPQTNIFLAGHNIESVRKAAHASARLIRSRERDSPVEFGLLQGMADEVSCELLDLMDQVNGDLEKNFGTQAIQTFKCLTWGSLRDCMHFLLRRAVENQGAAQRLGDSTKDNAKELKRRFIGRLL